MSKLKHGGLREPKGGRPPLSNKKKRVRCGWMTLPQWLKDWLLNQEKPAGHIIEETLIEKFNINPEGEV